MHMKYAIDQQMVIISAQNPLSIEFHRRQFIKVYKKFGSRDDLNDLNIFYYSKTKGLGTSSCMKLRTVQRSGAGAEPQEFSPTFCRFNMLIIVAY